MNTRINNILFLLLVLLCFSFILYKLTVRIRQVQELRKRLYETEMKQDATFTRLKNSQLRLKMSFLNENQQLDSGLLVKNENGEKLKLSELVKDGKKLVLRLSNTHCSACLFDLCPYVAKFLKAVGKEHVLYLADYENDRVLRLMKSNYKISNEVYSIKQLNLPIEASNVPFLFILDDRMKVELLFAPIKEIPELTQDYFNAVQYRLW